MTKNKIKNKLSEKDSRFLEVMRDAWHAAKAGGKVCIIVNKPCTWEEIFGRYYLSLRPYVCNGIIYLRDLSATGGELKLQESDLTNHLVEVFNE